MRTPLPRPWPSTTNANAFVMRTVPGVYTNAALVWLLIAVGDANNQSPACLLRCSVGLMTLALARTTEKCCTQSHASSARLSSRITNTAISISTVCYTGVPTHCLQGMQHALLGRSTVTCGWSCVVPPELVVRVAGMRDYGLASRKRLTKKPVHRTSCASNQL